MKTRKPKPPTITYNPEWAPEWAPRDRWRIVENASKGLRIVGAAHDVLESEGRRMDRTGWFLDPWGDGETATGYVLQLPGADRAPRYVPAIADPYNDDAFIVDFHDIGAEKVEAARAADRMAELYAEAEREYQTRDAAERRAEESREEIAAARKAHSALAAELRAFASWRNISAPAICSAIRAQLQAQRDTVRAAVKRIRTLADNPYAVLEGRF
jgi:hypothetical protein